MIKTEDELAPLVVFAYNRPEVLETTLKSLANNKLASQTELYVFIDGPKNPNEINNVNKVIDIANRVQGFKGKQVIPSGCNKGLAKSIISGVSKIFDSYDKIIVVEDDLYVAPCFLEYMNLMLIKYKDDNRIFQVSGFGTKLSSSKYYDQDVYLNHRAQSWSWGTWKNRWQTVDWEVKDYDNLLRNKSKQRAFNKAGSDLFGMLKGYMEKRNNSWFVRFAYSMFLQHKYTICPVKSLVRNDGFGSEGTHCNNAYNRYTIDFNDKPNYQFKLPNSLEWDEKVAMDAIRYWSVRYRIYGKLMLLKQKVFSK